MSILDEYHHPAPSPVFVSPQPSERNQYQLERHQLDLNHIVKKLE
jgi:hypothetical protein